MGEAPDLKKLLGEVSGYLVTQPQSTDRDRILTILDQIKRLNPIAYEHLTEDDIVELAIRKPEIISGGLEKLIRTNPEISLRAIPQSAIDPLTELYQKWYFETVELPKKLAEAESNHTPLSVVYIDIDEFKKINEKYDHQVGDQLLQHFGKLLRSNFRFGVEDRRFTQDRYQSERRKDISDRRHFSYGKDLIARLDKYDASLGHIGGDEFALVLYGCNLRQSYNIMNRFLEKLQKAKLHNEQHGTIGITISAGIAEYESGLGSKDLIKMADDAAKAAKNEGRNRVKIYDPLMKR